MNARNEHDACLELLYRGLVKIRALSFDKDTEQIEAIADALHNLPHLLQGRAGWTLAAFREMFLAPLADRYPELAEWQNVVRNA